MKSRHGVLAVFSRWLITRHLYQDLKIKCYFVIYSNRGKRYETFKIKETESKCRVAKREQDKIITYLAIYCATNVNKKAIEFRKMYVIHCFSLFFFVGHRQPCPYGQTGTSLSTCSGEYFNDRVRRKHPLIFVTKSFLGSRYFT